MSELLYPSDSYLREFDARVTGVDEENRAVALDRSAADSALLPET